MEIIRGDIFYADLSPAVGSEQGGCRPVVILQNNVGNRHAPTTIVAPITSRLSKKQLPTHITFNGCGLPKDSVILMEQIRTIDKGRLKQKMGCLTDEKWEIVNQAIKISLGLAQVNPRPGRAVILHKYSQETFLSLVILTIDK